MRLFGRRQPLHRRLAAAGGLSLDEAVGSRGPAAAPPGWDGEQRGEPGIHGVPRARRWDAVATAEAPSLGGDEVHFAALPDGSLVVDDDGEVDDAAGGDLSPLADALEGRLEPPYRAEGVRRSGSLWGVAGRRIAVVREPALDGDEAELVVTSGGRTLTVDGHRRVARAPALEAAGGEEGTEFVVRATRLDGDLWEVETAAL
ncbi:MAG TPA: hypothetical protein VFU56_03845 [Gaiellaceae bacterium]|nr:hypothetical protein [Gaiellaceae bacterium]